MWSFEWKCLGIPALKCDQSVSKVSKVCLKSVRYHLLVEQLVCRLSGSQKLFTVEDSVFVVQEVLDASVRQTMWLIRFDGFTHLLQSLADAEVPEGVDHQLQRDVLYLSVEPSLPVSALRPSSVDVSSGSRVTRVQVVMNLKALGSEGYTATRRLSLRRIIFLCLWRLYYGSVSKWADK